MSEIHQEFEKHAIQDQERFESINLKLDTMNEAIKDFNTMKPQIQELIEAQKEFLEIWRSLGKGKKLLITVAILVGSTVTIFGGFKTLLGWFR